MRHPYCERHMTTDKDVFDYDWRRDYAVVVRPDPWNDLFDIFAVLRI